MGFWNDVYLDGKLKEVYRNTYSLSQTLVTIWIEPNSKDTYDIFFFHSEIDKIKKIGTGLTLKVSKEIADDYLDYCGYDIISDRLETLA